MQPAAAATLPQTITAGAEGVLAVWGAILAVVVAVEAAVLAVLAVLAVSQP